MLRRLRSSKQRRATALALSAVLLACLPGLAADDGVITLRLNEPARGQELGSRSVISVPPSITCPVPSPDVKGASVVLMDAQTGHILYARNPNVRRPNASTTKIMTAILLIEHCGMNETIRASKKASETLFTSIHLKPGEEICARDLLMALMVRSANDAAVAAAEHIAGSVPKFAKMMNRKAAEIGCRNTHFVTPNGLYNKNHYSTAYDLCLMARYGFRYSVFNEAVNTRKHILASRTRNKEDLAVFSHSKFLRDYPGADGVKSGYIKEAGYCYVGSATRDGWRLVSAVLKSDNAGRDTTALMDYGFGGFEPYTVARANDVCSSAMVDGGSEQAVLAVAAKDLTVAVPKTGAKIVTTCDFKPVRAPVEKGATLGRMTATVNGVPAGSVDLHAAENVTISFGRRLWWWTKVCGVLAAVCMVGRRYGRTTAKGPRRRGRRVAPPLRDFNRYR